jgi:hypothetical protein
LTYGANKTEIVFGEGYENCLGYMLGKTDNKGNLTLLVIDEIFMPYDWAKVKSDEAEDAELVTVTDGIDTFAKYIYIKDILFTAEVIDNENIIYSATGVNLAAAVFSDYNLAKKYYDAANEFMSYKNDAIAFGGGEDGSIKVKINFGGNGGLVSMAAGVQQGAGVSLFKRESGYWADRNNGNNLGLILNFDAMEEYLRTYGLDVNLGSISEKVTENGTWSIGDISTGATLTCFKFYMYTAKMLYDKLVA